MYSVTVSGSDGTTDMVTTSTTSIDLEELTPATDYTVQVVGVSGGGAGPSGPPATFTTLDGSELIRIKSLAILSFGLGMCYEEIFNCVLSSQGDL